MLPTPREESKRNNTIIYVANTGLWLCLYFHSILITYESYTVVSNSEPLQQTAMQEVVLAMLYGAHLYQKNFYCT